MSEFHRGAYVSWVTPIGTNRFGCVKSIHEDKALVIASNGEHWVYLSELKHEPDCKDAIVADQEAIYGPKSTWKKTGPFPAHCSTGTDGPTDGPYPFFN